MYHNKSLWSLFMYGWLYGIPFSFRTWMQTHPDVMRAVWDWLMVSLTMKGDWKSVWIAHGGQFVVAMAGIHLMLILFAINWIWAMPKVSKIKAAWICTEPVCTIYWLTYICTSPLITFTTQSQKLTHGHPSLEMACNHSWCTTPHALDLKGQSQTVHSLYMVHSPSGETTLLAFFVLTVSFI